MKKILFALMLCSIFTSCSEDYDYYFPQPRSTVSKNGITINTSIGSPNSVGGCNVCFNISNQSEKEIKKIHIDVMILDYYNERVYDDISGSSYSSCTITGPIYAFTDYICCNSRLFYDYSAKNTHITYCLVEFADGSKLKIQK